MAQRIIESLGELKRLVGQEVAVSDYMQMTQERIDRFAETTEDRQWIHVDLERARAESPYRNTIAHGFLTLSLLSRFIASAIKVQGVRMGINYGLDRVRFPAAVSSGSSVRARFRLLAMEDIAGGVQVKWGVSIECEGATKPSCAAEWLLRWYA